MTYEKAEKLGLGLVQVCLGEMHLLSNLLTYIREGKADSPHIFSPSWGVIHMSIRDPFNATSVHGGQNSVGIETTSGIHRMKLEEFLEVAYSLQPDILTTMAEECPCSERVGNKRIRRAVESSTRNLTETLKWREENNLTSKVRILANLQGGSSKEFRLKAAADSPDVDGYSFGGFGYEEPLSQRLLLVSCVEEALPANKPRFMTCNGSPIQILQAVWMGIDIIECSYPVHAANAGLCLNFTSKMPQDIQPKSDDYEVVHALLTTSQIESLGEIHHVNLLDTFATSQRPLIEHPNLPQEFVYTHTYVSHLLQCHEMLGVSTLTWLNYFSYVSLLSEIRSSIQAATLNTYIRWFIESQFDTKNDRIHLKTMSIKFQDDEQQA